MEKIEYMYAIKAIKYSKEDFEPIRVTYAVILGIYTTLEIADKAMDYIIKKTRKLDYVDHIEIQNIGGYTNVCVYFKDKCGKQDITKYVIEKHPVNIYPS